MPERPCISIFGKSWDLHVSRALGITENENLTIIAETVRYLKDHGKEVVYDAEHFFDGYIHNRDFALRTLEAAKHAGADVLCLCDTNGGTLTGFLAQIVADVRSTLRWHHRHPHAQRFRRRRGQRARWRSRKARRTCRAASTATASAAATRISRPSSPTSS